jgi:quinol monooxygenase YgiN
VNEAEDKAERRPYIGSSANAIFLSSRKTEEAMAGDKDGVIVLYTAKAKSGKEKELREALISGITGSRHDEGNISYELHEVVGDSETFIFYEQWISQAALDAHLETPALKKLKEMAPELMEGNFEAGMKLLKKLRPAK